MPKFGKYRIKNQLSCLIFENPALIPIQMLCSFGSCEWPVPSLVNAVVVPVATEVVAPAKLDPVMGNR